MSAAGVETTQRWFPARVLTAGSPKVLKGYVRDRGLSDGDGIEVLETYEISPVASVFEAPTHVLERELEFRGMGPLQARAEAGLEGARRQWADQTRALARQVDGRLPGPWLVQAAGSCEIAARRDRIGSYWRPSVFHAFAWGMVLAAVLSVVTAFMVRSGADLTPIWWVIVILAVGLGIFSAFLAYRRSENSTATAKFVDAVEWRQAVMALEINAIWDAIRSGPPPLDTAMVTLGESPLADDSMRVAAADLDNSIAALYWSYRDLVEQVLEDAIAFGDVAVLNAAQSHLTELENVAGQFSPRSTPPTNVALLDSSNDTAEIMEQDGLIAIVLALLFSAAVGMAQLGIPVAILNETSCSFANADVKIENCEDLTELNASGAELPEVNLDRKNLTEANFANADLTSASLFKAILTNSTMTEVNLSTAKGQEVDMTGADLLKANLSGADFAGASFDGADLSGANLSKTDLSEASFIGANLSGANLSGANLDGAILDGANLVGANLKDATYAEASFIGSNFSGNNLTGYDLSELNLESADFSKANLTNVSFENANLLGANISGANITGLKLAGATIAEVSVKDLLDGGANLEGVDLSEADFGGISGTSVVLTNADLDGVDLSQLDLTNANFDGSSMEGANLSGADLSGASLKGSNLANADLSVAEISTVNMDEASLLGADMTDVRALNGSFLATRFSGADLVGADFSGSNLTGATGLGVSAARAQWKDATCPNGAKQEVCR
jgi:uncharacterized protein YjbI with pentapeptide repeats